MSSVGPEPAAKPASESVDRIVAVARDLFARNGFARVSVGQIAAGAQTSKANIFYHFGSKRDLYLVAVKYALEAFDRKLAELEEHGLQSVGTFEDFVLTVGLRELSGSVGHANTTLLIRGLIDQDDDASAQLVRELSQQTFARYTRMVARLSGNSVLDENIDSRALTIMLTASHFMYTLFLPSLGDALPTPEEYSSQVVRILSHGVLAEGHRQLERI